jgi:hypothetical protein
MEYMIVHSMECVEDLEHRVIELIKDGWRPLGAPCIAISESDTYFYFHDTQTLTKEDD